MKAASYALIVAVFALVACGESDPVGPDGPDGPGGPNEPEVPENPVDPNGDGVVNPVGSLTLSTGGHIIATYTADANAPALYTFGLDGADPQPILVEAPSEWIELRASASPTTGRIVFQVQWPFTKLVTSEDPDSPIFPDGPAQQVWAQFSADGDSVLFAGGANAGETNAIYIGSVDGGTPRLVWSSEHELVSPSLSPSRERLAVITWHGLDVVDLATEEVIGTVPGADVAKFSPTDDRIALLIGGDLFLADANGADATLLLAAPAVGFSERNLAWSPDGEWLIVHEPIAPHAWPGELVLVRVADAYTERLGASEFSQATWAP